MSIILRKVRGLPGLTPVFRTNTGSFGTSAPAGRVFAVLVSPWILAFLAVAFLLAIFMAVSPADAFASPIADTVLTAITAPAVTPSPKLKELQDKIAAKSQRLHEIFEKAGGDVDFSHKDVLSLTGCKDSAAVVDHVKSLNKELDDLGRERDGIAEVDRIRTKNAERMNTPANPITQPGSEEPANAKSRILSLGEVVMNSRAVKNYRQTRTIGASEEAGFGLKELKALFITSSGWAPESTRVPGLVVDAVTRPIQVLDIIPAGRTDKAAVVHMEETTRTHASAERAEGAAYAESTFVLTQRSSTVRSIGDSVPVTDEQLDDVEGAESYLTQRLMFGVRQRLDRQVLIGDGIAPNLTGLLNASGLQTQAKGTDPTPDAVYKAMRLVRVTGRAFPNAAVFHPSDWEAIRLLRTADGQYIWGSPSEAGPERIWGIRVVLSDALTENTGLVGDFANFCMLFERKGIEVAIGYVNTQFTEGEKTIRAGLRAAFVTFRGAAFCQITGI